MNWTGEKNAPIDKLLFLKQKHKRCVTISNALSPGQMSTVNRTLKDGNREDIPCPQFLDVCVVNAYILHKQLHQLEKYPNLKHFRLDVPEVLIGAPIL